MWLGVCCSEEGAVEWRWRISESRGTGGWTASQVEGHNDHSPIYESYWDQWNSLLIRDSVLECHWESADGQSKTVQIVIPQSKVKEILGQIYGGPSERHLGVNKTPDKAMTTSGYKWGAMLRDGAKSVAPARQAEVPKPGADAPAQCQGTIWEDHHRKRRNQHLLIATDYFTG
jgi:hypothetical protein